MSVRLVVCDDSLLFREGLARVLGDLGFEVVGHSGDAEQLMRCVERTIADVALVDVRLPSTHTGQGSRAALALGRRQPGLGVIVLSHYIETTATMSVLDHAGGGRGYLLKDRVADLTEFSDAIRRVAAGESVVDATVAEQLVQLSPDAKALATLTDREFEILRLMAEGRSNAGICERVFLSHRTVESHVRSIFRKLGLEDAPDDNRRVLAVLAYLRG